MSCTENRRILLIDDTPAIHEDFRKILVQTSEALELDQMEEALFGAKPQEVRPRFQVDSAYQGEEGLAKVIASLEDGRPYAMAFVDMRMPPGWDGVDTIEHLWQADPRLQVVICTAYSDYSWEDVLQRLEVGDRLLILKKPFDAIEVCQLASALTAKWQLGRQAELKMAALEEAVDRRTEELAGANAALQADIVERKRAQQEAMDAYRRLSDILEFLPDATVVLDAQGMVIAWNHAMEVMSGASKEEMLGQGERAYSIPFYGTRKKALIDMLDEEAPEMQRSHYPGIRREGRTLFAEARVMLRGEVRFLWSAATPLYDTKGDRVGSIQTLRDITELRRNEQERIRLEAEVHHSALMQSLMSQLGHDLKTPLTPLFALLPMIEKKLVEPEMKRILEICQKSVNQIHALSSKAFEMMRVSSGQAPLTIAPVPLGSTVNSCIGGCTPLFSKRGITCRNEVGERVLVEAAPDQLILLLDNLLSNAARYAAENGSVRVSAAIEEQVVTVSVRDDGVGLKPGQANQIFEEFFKADTARQDLSTQGLGLAICKRIVMNHKGRIWAESPGLGQGTTIHFTVRLARTTLKSRARDKK